MTSALFIALAVPLAVLLACLSCGFPLRELRRERAVDLLAGVGFLALLGALTFVLLSV